MKVFLLMADNMCPDLDVNADLMSIANDVLTTNGECSGSTSFQT